jgi:hypothetical protein
MSQRAVRFGFPGVEGVRSFACVFGLEDFLESSPCRKSSSLKYFLRIRLTRLLAFQTRRCASLSHDAKTDATIGTTNYRTPGFFAICVLNHAEKGDFEPPI